MRHVYIRFILGLIWLAAAIASVFMVNLPMAGLYVILCIVFWYSACSLWKKEKDGKGEK